MAPNDNYLSRVHAEWSCDVTFVNLYRRDIKCKSTKRHPNCSPLNALQLFTHEAQENALTTWWKVTPEDGISPHLSLEDSEKEEA